MQPDSSTAIVKARSSCPDEKVDKRSRNGLDNSRKDKAETPWSNIEAEGDAKTTRLDKKRGRDRHG